LGTFKIEETCKNRYSAGIYTPKGVGEGEKPGLEGAQRGIGWMRVPRNLHPHVNTHCLVGEISLRVRLKHRDSIILWVYLSLVCVNPSISLIFPSKIGNVFEKYSS